jgi:hypothetical protein
MKFKKIKSLYKRKHNKASISYNHSESSETSFIQVTNNGDTSSDYDNHYNSQSSESALIGNNGDTSSDYDNQSQSSESSFIDDNGDTSSDYDNQSQSSESSFIDDNGDASSNYDNQSQSSDTSLIDNNGDTNSDSDYSVTSSQSSIDSNKIRKKISLTIPYVQTKYMSKFTDHYISVTNKSKLYEMNRLVHLLIWTYSEANNNNVLPTHACKAWTYSLFTTHLQSIYSYCYKYLRLVLQLQYATIKLFLSQVLNYYHEWFSYLRRDCSTKYIITHENKFNYVEIIKTTRKMFSRQEKKLCKGIKKTKKYYIENHKLPDGDSLEFITTLIQKKYYIFQEMSKHLSSINKYNYNRFIKLFCSSFYIGAQGRTRSVEDLLYKDMEVLLKASSYLESEKFKTASSLIVQPVSLTWLGRYTI